ncbi:penicillin-binding protein [Camelliibacillus cellulosilyticus]|uniref:Penicillin-binding protein n=1 Tax=Camelliibacillus cellulosilyticus TaxID=2174486 RepID=A0ABV9GK58_9BACL
MFPRKNISINRWAAVLALVFLLVFIIIFGRFVYLAEAKEVSSHNLVKIGKNQWTTVKQTDAHRGEILGPDGTVYARDIPAYTVFAVVSDKAPSYVKDKEKTAQALAPILDMDEKQVYEILNKPGRFQVEFGSHGKKLSADKMEAIKKRHLPGIFFSEESKRYYPNGAFAPYVIGFTNYQDKLKKDTGVMGVESSLNDYLTEQDGTVSFYSDKNGVIMPNGQKQVKKPHDGDNVYLTIDNKIQTVLDDAMSKVDKDYHPKRMVAIALNPKTGAVLAMSNRPTYNPNQPDLKHWENYAIAAPFEPGSVMKSFTLAAAINEGVWPGNQTYKSGAFKVNDEVTLHDWSQSWGRITFNEGFLRSSNVAFSIVEDKYLGSNRFKDYLNRFGFTRKTGIDLPGESGGNLNFKYRTDQVMNSFGQSSAFTPIQIVQAATAIANDGKMVQPYVVQKIVDPNSGKIVKNHEPQVVGEPIKKETAKKVREMMRQVVADKKGTGYALYNLKNYQVIGKTGTAQIAVNGHYLTGRDNYVFSFLGMAPENDPKVIVYVAIDRPHLKEGELDAQPVSDVFNPVMESALQYLKVAPNAEAVDKDKTVNDAVKVADWTGKSVQEAEKTLKADGMTVITVGDQNTVRQQSIYPGEKVLPGSQIILDTGGTRKMPNITGWSLSEVMGLAKLLDAAPTINGDGFVISQKPAPGTVLKSQAAVSVELNPAAAKPKDQKNQKDSGKHP